MQRRQLRPARGLHLLVGVVRGVHPAEALDRAGRAVLRVALVGLQPVDVEARHIDRRVTRGDPLRDRAAHPAAGEDADRVEPGGHEVAAHLGRLADHRLKVGGEALGAAEELPDADLVRHRDAAHRGLEVRAHAVPVRRQLEERRGVGDPVDLPRRAHRLEEADHQAAALLAEVAEVGRVLEHRERLGDLVELLGDQVVVLGRLQRHVDAVLLGELPRPHAGAVHDDLALDVAVRRVDAGDRAVLRRHRSDRHALEHRRALQARALRQSHRHVDRVGAAVLGHVEAGEHVVDTCDGEHLLHLAGGDLLHVDAAVPVERRHAAVLLQARGVGRDLDEADGCEPGRLPGLGLEPRVEVARVLPELGRGLRGRPEGDHEAGRVPRGAGREPVSLEQHRVGPAELGQVVRDRGADDTAADDHDAGTGGENGIRHGGSVRGPVVAYAAY